MGLNVRFIVGETRYECHECGGNAYEIRDYKGVGPYEKPTLIAETISKEDADNICSALNEADKAGRLTW